MSEADWPSEPDLFEADPSGGVAVQTAEDPVLIGFDRSRRMLVTGASGFVGTHLVDRLTGRGHRVVAVSRRGRPEDRAAEGEKVRWISADVTDPDQVAGLAEGCDAVVHLAGVRDDASGQAFVAVHVDATAHLLAEARRSGAERFVYMSSLGASPTGTPFFRTKYEGEERVRRSGLDWVVLRSSAIFGPGDHFSSVAARWLSVCPVFPVPSTGGASLRPAAVEDVVDALCQAAEGERIPMGTYLLAGPDDLSLEEAVRTVADVMGLRRWIVSVPGPLAGRLFRLAERLGLPTSPVRSGWWLLTRRPELRLRVNHFRSVFQIEPLPFRVALEDYL